MSAYSKNIPYNELPALPPSTDIESREVLKKTIDASRSLAKLNGAIRNLPNPQIFLDSIHLQEAKASSEVENIITTNDDLFRQVVADKNLENPRTKEVINYKNALWHGLNKLEQAPFITTNLCIEIVQHIKQNTSGIRKTSGTTLSNYKGEVIYTPPTGESVIREKLANLEIFINKNKDLDPLIRMAVMHYQFEAIHPFTDGNGRTGRILLLLFLKMEKLLDIPAIFPSQYIMENKRDYYLRLQAVTEENDWISWILYMMDMIEVTAQKALERLENITSLMQIVAEEIKTNIPKVYSKDLVEILFKLPYTKRQYLLDANLGNLKTVGNYLNELEKEGILQSVKIGKEKLYLNHRLMNILEKK